MSNLKTVDMSVCIGSDTLCGMNGHRDIFFLDEIEAGILKEEDIFNEIMVFENKWQSTANNIVIPEGLICDVGFIGLNGYITEVSSVTSGSHLDSVKLMHEVTAIRVTGLAEGWRYEWMGENEK